MEDVLVMRIEFPDEVMRDAEIMAETAEEMIEAGEIDEATAEELIVGMLWSGAKLIVD